MSDLTKLTVREALAGLQEKKFSSRELTQAFMQQIETQEPEIHAFITQTPELALKRADEADLLLQQDNSDMPSLMGLPLAVKDVLCMTGAPCTCGSKILENFIPPFNATTVQRLLDAGVVPLGKTNTDEFAMGSSTENSGFKITRNPWDLDQGSSG